MNVRVGIIVHGKQVNSAQLIVIFVASSSHHHNHRNHTMAIYYKIVTARAPVNIAVIKYWGKLDESLKIPINDSISGTLNLDEMCATTTVAISDTFQWDELWLNGDKQNLSNKSHAKILIDEIRKLSNLDAQVLQYKAHIVSYNNFPTAAGLASSAAGYACLAYVLGHTYGVTDSVELSKLARRGSGSACRSLFGGFVQWQRGADHETSKAAPVVNHKHWPEMRVIICVINDQKKDVSSSEGMLRSVKTSQLLSYRADKIVPERVEAMKQALLKKDFNSFADLTMQDSNQFHAICLDTYPPLFYLSDESRQVIKICSMINTIYGSNKVAYTFDAGPNACIYLLDDFVDVFISIIQKFFPKIGENGLPQELPVKGKTYKHDVGVANSLCETIELQGAKSMPNSINYLINTSIGEGPQLIDKHLEHESLLK